MNIRNSIITAAFVLSAGFVVADQAPSVSSSNSADSEAEFAAPQPEIPVCSRCNLGKTGDYVPNNDELSIEIDAVYKGEVSWVMMTTWDSASNPSYHYFSTSTVLNSINDPDIDETIVYVEAPDAVTAQLLWVHSGGSQLNTVTVEDED